MKTTFGRALFASLMATSIAALSLTVVSSARAVEDNACYPPTGAACQAESQDKVTLPTPTATPTATPKPTTPADDNEKADLALKLKNTEKAKPVAFSDSVTLGGSKDTIALSKTVNTNGKNVAIGTTLGAPTRVKAGPYAPKKYHGYIRVWVSTSGSNRGAVDLGNFTPDANGYIVLPAVTLESGGLATFILREECLTSYCPITLMTFPGSTVKEKGFTYNRQARKYADYGRGTTPDSILIGRSIVTIAERQ